MFKLLLGRSAALEMAFMASMIPTKAKFKFKNVEKYQSNDKIKKTSFLEKNIIDFYFEKIQFQIC